ncbi:MAG TPA: hypothetical protein VM347_06840 [Nonomuraea sp.]|nr:hypothetical protein [Nonomuraea sp.]
MSMTFGRFVTAFGSSLASSPACAAWFCTPSSISATSICGAFCWALSLATVSVELPAM